MMTLEKVLREIDSGMKKEGGSFWITVKKEELKKRLKYLKASGINRISSITGVDTEAGIEVIYHLEHEKEFVNVKTILPKDRPEADTITDLFPGANLFERELMEMLGVRIRGHPNPKKLFLADDSPESPLRRGE
jgi:NADH:ubiquinone oxidoreductase subunit C